MKRLLVDTSLDYPSLEGSITEKSLSARRSPSAPLVFSLFQLYLYGLVTILTLEGRRLAPSVF